MQNILCYKEGKTVYIFLKKIINQLEHALRTIDLPNAEMKDSCDGVL